MAKTSKKSPARKAKNKNTAAERASVAAEIKKIRERAAREIERAKSRLVADAAKNKERARAQAQKDKQRQQRDKAAQKKEVERVAKAAQRTGIISGKSKSKTYRTRRAKSLGQQLRDFLNPKKYVFVATRSKRAKASALREAKALQFPTTPKGFFFPREGAKRVKLEYDKKRKTYAVVSERAEKKGAGGKRKTVTRRFMIEPITSADKLKEGIAAQSAKHGKLKGNQRLAFTVQGPHLGHSKRTYQNKDLLIKDLEMRYDRSTGELVPAPMRAKRRAQFLDFLTLVSVQKTTVAEWVKKRQQRRKSKPRK